MLSCPGPGRLLAVSAPIEVGLGNLGEPCQLHLLSVTEIGQDGDLAVVVDEVLGKLALPHGLAHLVQQVVAGFGQLKVAVEVMVMH